MKKSGLLILFGLMPIMVCGQYFETNLTMSPIMTFENNKTDKSSNAMGFSVSVREYYNLTNNFAIGSEIAYSLENFKLKKDYEGLWLPTMISFFDCQLTAHSIKIPLILRLQTKSDWSLNVGYGLTYVIDFSSSVDYVTSLWNSEYETRTEIHEKSIEAENDINSYFTVGFGKAFKIKKLRLLTGIYYDYSFADYKIEHSSPYEPGALYLYKIRPHYIGFKVGIEL